MKEILNNEILNNQYPDYEIDCEITLSITKANIYGTMFFIVIIGISIIIHSMLWGFDSIDNVLNSGYFLYVFIMVVIFGSIIHEFLHGFGYVVFGGVSWKEVKFGVIWRWLIPYAGCRVPITLSAYRLSIILPGIVLGIIPTFIGLMLGNGWLTIWGSFSIAGAFGDLMIFILLLKHSTAKTNLVFDNPNKIGCYLFRNKNK